MAFQAPATRTAAQHHPRLSIAHPQDQDHQLPYQSHPHQPHGESDPPLVASGSSSVAQPLPPTPDPDAEWIVFSPSSAAGNPGPSLLSTTTALQPPPVSDGDLASVITASSLQRFPCPAAATLPGTFDERSLVQDSDEEGVDDDDNDYDDDDDDEDYSHDGAETDSLQPFRDQQQQQQQQQQSLQHLPTHDGLGTFRSSSPPYNAISAAAAASTATGFLSLEESLRIVAAASEAGGGGGGSELSDTHARIHKWRLEQGNALMDEIERATRHHQRRRRHRQHASLASRGSGRAAAGRSAGRGGSQSANTEAEQAELDREPLDLEQENQGHQDQDQQELRERAQDRDRGGDGEADETANETLWRRITRSFIRDIMGIDDHLLEVIFGEALPAGAHAPARTRARARGSTQEAWPTQDVEERILSRIAKELGELVHLYTRHPSSAGAFSAPRHSGPLGRGGVWAEMGEDEDGSAVGGYVRGGADGEDGSKTPQPRFNRHPHGPASPQARTMRRRSASLAGSLTSSGSDSAVPHFKFTPTLAMRREEASHAALWGIEEGGSGDDDDGGDGSGGDNCSSERTWAQLRQEYWEQELDVRLVFSFFKSRFTGLALPGGAGTTASASASAAAAANPMTPLHHHHPLINRRHDAVYYRNSSTNSSSSNNNAQARVLSPTVSGLGLGHCFGPGGAGGASGAGRAGGPSKLTGSGCAGVRERRQGGKAAVAGSARHSHQYYWDVATSVGSGQTGSCVGTGMWAAI